MTANKMVSCVLCCLFATFISPAMGNEISFEHPLPASITGSMVNLRLGHSVSYRVTGRLDKGEQVEVIKEWSCPSVGGGTIESCCKIRLVQESVTLPKGLEVMITGFDEQAQMVAVSFLLRGEKVSGYLPANFVSPAKREKWYLIERGNRTKGWVSGRYVQVRDLYEQAMELLGRYEYEKALFAFNEVLKVYPFHVDALFQKGLCLSCLERHRDALRIFKEVPVHCPSHPLALAWLGYSLQNMKQYEKAVIAYSALLRLHPRHDVIGPVSDHLLECLDILGLPENTLSSEKEVEGFILSHWEEGAAGDILKGSTRGSGKWETCN